jgi:flagellar motor protein MotB
MRPPFAAARGLRPETTWPALIDLVSTILMVFLLVGFLQTVLNPRNLAALEVKARQERLMQLFREELGEEIAAEQISIRQHQEMLQITFADGVLFESGDHRLDRRARSLLGRCARVLAAAGGGSYSQIQVEGHTDDRPVPGRSYPSDNWELSSARAIGVVRFLSRQAGLPGSLFSASGYADQRPVASNRNAEGRGLNRRIEIRLFFLLSASEAGGGHAA